MARTEIHGIKHSVSAAVDYITDKEKTEKDVSETSSDYIEIEDERQYISGIISGAKYVTSFLCSANGEKCAEDFEMIRQKGTGKTTVLAQHMIQSFKPDETNPEQAHQLGIEWLRRCLNDEYQYILATHIDKNHIHNHVIFNNVDMNNYRSWEYAHNRKKQGYMEIRRHSDDVCRENNLSVIENPKDLGKHYFEWLMDGEGMSWKSQLRQIIDEQIIDSDSFDDLLERVKNCGAEVFYKPQNKISLKFKLSGQKRWSRAKTLGWHYDESQLRRRIEELILFRTGTNSKEYRSRTIDTSTEKMQSSFGLRRWAEIQNMKEISRLINELGSRKCCDEIQKEAAVTFNSRVDL